MNMYRPRMTKPQVFKYIYMISITEPTRISYKYFIIRSSMRDTRDYCQDTYGRCIGHYSNPCHCLSDTNVVK